MTWQLVVLVLGILAFLASMVHLNNKNEMGKKGLQMMEENNVLLKMFMEHQNQ